MLRSDPRSNTSKNDSLRSRSLVDALGEQTLQISQSQVNFVNTEPNELYEISLTLRNVSQHSQKIKVRRPASPLLTVHSSREGSVAAGLEIKLTVVFDSRENRAISDRIVVVSDAAEVEIPVNVHPHIPKLQFEPFLNLGFGRLGSVLTGQWEVTNQAETPLTVKLTPLLADAAAKLVISQVEFTLQAGEKRTITVSLSSGCAGTVEGSIEIEPKSLGYSTLEFVANFCEFARLITDAAGRELSLITLDPLFAGEVAAVSAFLVNNTPQSCEFRVARKKGAGSEQGASLMTPEQIGRDDSEKLVQFWPSQGELQAYSSAQLRAQIHAKYEESDLQSFCNYILGKQGGQMLEKEWSYALKTYLNHEDHHLDLQIRGTSLVPKLALTPTFLHFPDCPLQRRIKRTLKLENFSPKTVVVQFENSPNYFFTPARVRLQSNSAVHVEVTFSPKIMGELNEICCLTLGVFSFPLKLFGRSVFASPLLDQGEELPLSELQASTLEEEVSAIQRGRQSPLSDISKNTIHFDTYRQQSQLQPLPTDKSDSCKRTRLLRGKNGKEVKLDLNHLNPSQAVEFFPAAAKNQQEERLVSRELTSHELRNIAVGPVVIEVGTIFLRSAVRKTFHVCNFNPRPIAMRIESTHDSFAETSEERQILPGESHGGFSIHFEALVEGNFKYTLQYVLNGNHFFELMLVGTCVLPTLALSRTELRFAPAEDDRKFEKKEILKLDNAYDYDVEFEWKSLPSSLFAVEPATGIVKANSSLNTVVGFSFESLPDGGAKIEQALKLKIKHGKQLQVKCSAFVPDSPCICKATEVQFKEIAVGKAYESKVLLKNLSKNATIYRVSIPKELEGVLTATPKSGAIAAEEVTEVVFKVFSARTMQLEANASIIVRGSKPIELPIKASIILPSVRVQNDEIDFGATPIEGNAAARTATLINDSPIAVDLQLRLHNDTFLSKLLKVSGVGDENLQLLQTRQLKNYRAICLRIAPKCRSSLLLEFTPETTEEYEFYLPLFIPNTEPIDELQKLCRCRGTRNRLTAALKEIVFGKIVIEQAEQVYSKSQVLEIRNPQEEPITWWVDENALAPFRLDRARGRLEGYEKTTLKIFFSAQSPGEYVRQLQFFLDQAEVDISRCYLRVPVSASACFPTLYFDQPYLILPVVKVGEESSALLEISNGGYENINLKHSVAQECSSVELRVKYLNGSNLGVTKKQIRVEVGFVADRPVSFTLKLTFHDATGRAFSINVSGTADTHVLTLLEQPQTTQNFPLAVDKSCQFLKHYINSTGQLPEELVDFPRSLMDNDFDKLGIFLSNYSNVFEKAKTTVRKNCKTFLGFEYISEVIKILKGEGAFLNHIRPEMLLSYEEYCENIRLRAEDNSAVLSHFKRKERIGFEVEQKHSWLVLFYQIFKVFSRVPAPKMKPNSEFWAKFAARQKTLISWLEKTYQAEANLQIGGSSSQILSSLSNGELLSALISKYTNIKVLECYGKGTKSQKQKQKRCKSVIETFAQIGINCLCRLEDLLRANEKEMLLVLQNLYLILPSYLQKGEPIVFSCQFGQIVTKAIEITNPSKHPITYVAKIEGSKAYSVEGDAEFIIDSKKTAEVRIRYVSNVNMNGSPATLTLTGKAANKFTPSTFIFLLKSNNLGRISEKNVQVTANLYEQLDFTLKVTNNFGQDGDFKVEMQAGKAPYCGFYLLTNQIKIRKGETAPLSLAFLPFTCDNQQIFLIFRDDKVGEFQYEVTGLVQSNVLCQEVLRIPQLLYTNKKYQLELPVPTRNDLILRARKAAEYLADRFLEKKIIQKDMKDNKDKDLKDLKTIYDKYYPKMGASESYAAKLTTPNNSIILKTEQLTIKDVQSGQDPSKREDQRLIFEINLKSPIKQGSFTVNLRNSTGTDIRKYKVTLNAIARPLRYELQLKTPLNKILAQPLPLINVSAERNTYAVTLVCNNELAKAALSIDCQRQMTVQAKQQSLITLSFKPKQLTTVTGVLKMENITTGQNIEYEIIGIAEQPEAEIVLLEQQVRKEKAYSIKLPFGKNIRCNVQHFTLENAQYQKTFTTAVDGSCFKFRFTPKISGKYEGKLLIEGEQTMAAYRMTVNVKNIIEGEIKMRTIERKQATAEIQLPIGKYRVINQDRNFKVANEVEIQEQGQTVAVSYYSSKPEEKELLVTFIDALLGEITYLVKVIVEPMPEIKLESFKVELGKMHKEVVTFENTDDCSMTITAKSSHPLIFFPEADTLKVPARSQISTHIIYKASSLQVQEGKLYFLSDKNAKWTYHLSGYGLPQTRPQVKQMRVFIGEQSCESITFSNPLNKTLSFNLALQNLTDPTAFSTILKSTKVELAYNQQLQIPITVKPRSVTLNKAILRISINEKVSWRYELRATTIYRCPDEPRSFKFPTRTKHEQLMEFPLPFSQEYIGQVVRLNVLPVEAGDAFLKAAVKPQTAGEAVVAAEKASFTLGILSFKPRNAQSLFEICAQNGCKWVYKCDFNFLPPAIDDRLQIVASINKPASVKFKLTNRLKTYAKYHAYFTSDSCIDFTVSPKSGELQPYGREGTGIEVVFCPTQYKKSWLGRLVIETEESYWSYEVKGALPHYSPPVGKSNLKQN